MKLLLFVVFSVSVSLLYSQKVTPFIDFSGYFKSFQDGYFRQIEFQPIKSFKAGDDVVAYVDNRGNLRVYDGSAPKDLANLNAEYQVSDHLMTWKIGSTLNMWDAGNKKTLTYYSDKYVVKDSMIVFQDLQYNSVNVYYNGDIYTLYVSAGTLSMPEYIGENILAFKDNGNFYKIFWRGQIYDFDVWHNPIVFNCGTDILVFNDPTMGTFTIFENGQFLDVETFAMRDFKAGRGFIVYVNQNGELIRYGQGEKKELTNFKPSFWSVVDDVIIWNENGITYGFQNGAKIELARYTPENYLLKNNVIVFQNLMGGVSALVDGEITVITNRLESTFEIYGNAVLVKLFNQSYIVFKDGKKIEI